MRKLLLTIISLIVLGIGAQAEQENFYNYVGYCPQSTAADGPECWETMIIQGALYTTENGFVGVRQRIDGLNSSNLPWYALYPETIYGEEYLGMHFYVAAFGKYKTRKPILEFGSEQGILDEDYSGTIISSNHKITGYVYKFFVKHILASEVTSPEDVLVYGNLKVYYPYVSPDNLKNLKVIIKK